MNSDIPTSPVIESQDGEDSAAVGVDDLLIEEVSIDGLCGVY